MEPVDWNDPAQRQAALQKLPEGLLESQQMLEEVDAEAAVKGFVQDQDYRQWRELVQNEIAEESTAIADLERTPEPPPQRFQPRRRSLRRLVVVLLQGAACGLAPAAGLGLGTLMIGAHEDRLTFAAVVSFLALLVAVLSLALGLFYWVLDALRMRPPAASTTVSQSDRVYAVAGPLLARLGSALLVVSGTVGIVYLAIDSATYGSWMYGPAF